MSDSAPSPDSVPPDNFTTPDVAAGPPPSRRRTPAGPKARPPLLRRPPETPLPSHRRHPAAPRLPRRSPATPIRSQRRPPPRPPNRCPPRGTNRSPNLHRPFVSLKSLGHLPRGTQLNSAVAAPGRLRPTTFAGDSPGSPRPRPRHGGALFRDRQEEKEEK